MAQGQVAQELREGAWSLPLLGQDIQRRSCLGGVPGATPSAPRAPRLL